MFSLQTKRNKLYLKQKVVLNYYSYKRLFNCLIVYLLLMQGYKLKYESVQNKIVNIEKVLQFDNLIRDIIILNTVYLTIINIYLYNFHNILNYI